MTTFVLFKEMNSHRNYWRYSRLGQRNLVPIYQGINQHMYKDCHRLCREDLNLVDSTTFFGGVWMCLFRGVYCLSHPKEANKQKTGVWMRNLKICLWLLPKGDKPFLISQSKVASQNQLISIYYQITFLPLISRLQRSPLHVAIADRPAPSSASLCSVAGPAANNHASLYLRLVLYLQVIYALWVLWEEENEHMAAGKVGFLYGGEDIKNKKGKGSFSLRRRRQQEKKGKRG